MISFVKGAKIVVCTGCTGCLGFYIKAWPVALVGFRSKTDHNNHMVPHHFSMSEHIRHTTIQSSTKTFFPFFFFFFSQLSQIRQGLKYIKKRCKTLLTLRKLHFFLFLAFVMERGQKFLSYDNRIYIFHQILLRWRSHICKGRKTKTRGIFVFQRSE